MMVKPLNGLHCEACGAVIGPDYTEKTPHRIGHYIICGWCLKKMAKRGHIELDGRRTIEGVGTICQWLYPDGSVRLMKEVIRRKKGVMFVESQR